MCSSDLVNVKKAEKVSLRDMWSLFKNNRALQMYIASASSDKIAQLMASQAVVNTMLFGIIIGNMQISMILTIVAVLPSIVFAIFGARYAGKHGNKEAMVTWTKVCIVGAVLGILFFIVVDPKKIAVAVPYMIAFHWVKLNVTLPLAQSTTLLIACCLICQVEA